MNSYGTEKHKKYWKERKADWETTNLMTWNHKHRELIVAALRMFDWASLFEIGCNAGANLVRIIKSFPGRQLGGIDINQDAIDVCSRTFKGGMFKVGSGDDIMISDKSSDVVLSDMTMIYISPRDIKKYLEEMKRIGRQYVILCEFHSKSWWNRLALKINTGYYAHNYDKLLQKLGYYDIIKYKLKPEDWPEKPGEEEPQKTFAYLIIARIPKYV